MRQFLGRIFQFADEHDTLVRSVAIAAFVIAAISAAASESVSLIQAIKVSWTILTFSGTIVASVNCREAVRDLRAMIGAGRDGTMKLQAEGAVFDQSLKVVALGSDFLGGVLSFVPQAGAFVLAMLCVSALMLINLSFAQERRRRRLLSMLRAHYAQEAAASDA